MARVGTPDIWSVTISLPVMERVQTRVGSVAVEVQGDGFPLVLLHATLHDHHDFDPILPALSERFRVFAIDWPGHGSSELPADLKLSASLVADILEDVLDELGIRSMAFIGNSVGGFAAARFAISHPSHVVGLVLVDAGGFLPQNLATHLFCRLMGMPSIARHIYPRFIHRYMRSTTENDRQIEAAAIARASRSDGLAIVTSMWRSFATKDHDLRDRAGDLTCPTLIIWGAKDAAIPLRQGRAVHKTLSDSQFAVLDTGHVAFSSAPEAFLSIVTPFLEQIG